jgi:hypothetical protein
MIRAPVVVKLVSPPEKVLLPARMSDPVVALRVSGTLPLTTAVMLAPMVVWLMDGIAPEKLSVALPLAGGAIKHVPLTLVKMTELTLMVVELESNVTVPAVLVNTAVSVFTPVFGHAERVPVGVPLRQSEAVASHVPVPPVPEPEPSASQKKVVADAPDASSKNSII